MNRVEKDKFVVELENRGKCIPGKRWQGKEIDIA